MFKINWWTSQQKLRLYLKSNIFRNKLVTIRTTILAILIGLIIGIFVMFMNGKNGFLFVQMVFQRAFTSGSGSVDSNYARTINYFIVYSFMGIGLALGFKVGLFNMGGSGQAVLGFGLSILMLMSLTGVTDGEFDINTIPTSSVISIFLIFIISGVFISMIAGALKVFLNIHEVATSILLNWSIWYLIKWLLKLNFDRADQMTTPFIPLGLLSIGGQSWVIGLIILLVFVGGLAFLLKYTTFGFKVNVVGKQITAAKYAGINDKFYIIMITALQGLFIGLGSMFYYISIVRVQSISNDIMPTIGFDAIAVALVASNNIFGILPIAFIWGIFKVGAEAAVRAPDMQPTSKYITDVIFALIIYSSTISVLLIKFTPVWWIKIKLYLYSNKELSKKVKELKAKLRLKQKNKINIHETNEYLELKKIINKNDTNSKDDVFESKKKIRLAKLNLHELVKANKIKSKKEKQDSQNEITSLISMEYKQHLDAKKIPAIELAKKEYDEQNTLNLNKIIVLKNDIISGNNLIDKIQKIKKILNSKKWIEFLNQQTTPDFTNYDIKFLKKSNNSLDFIENEFNKKYTWGQNASDYIKKRNLVLDDLINQQEMMNKTSITSATSLIAEDNVFKEKTKQIILMNKKNKVNRKEV